MLKRRILKILKLPLLFFFLLVANGSSCKPETSIDIAIDGNVPPTFSLSGRWWARDFYVLELVHQQKDHEGYHDFGKDKVIWKISMGYNRGDRASKWPKITYGVLPQGLSQEVPNQGSPSKLTEGPVYIAQAVDNTGNGGVCYFVIQQGKATAISASNALKVGSQ